MISNVSKTFCKGKASGAKGKRSNEVQKIFQPSVSDFFDNKVVTAFHHMCRLTTIHVNT